MKKFAVAMFAGLLILAIAAPLFAETYIDGMVFYRPRIYYNTDFIKDNLGKGNVNEERILPILALGAGYKAEDYAEAYFKLFTLGYGNALGGSAYGGVQTDTKYHEFALTQAWFDVKIPGTPVHYRLGRFAQSLGHGFYYNTGAYGGDGMKIWAPIGPVRLDLGYQKMNESNRFSRDIDQYFVQVGAPVAEKHQISAAIQWFEGRNLNISANPSSRTGYVTIDHIFTIWDPAITFDSHIYTLGVAADGSVPMAAASISYRAEAVYAFGQLTDDFEKTANQKEESISGFALLAGATATLGPATVTLELAYGSGDERGKYNKANFGSGTTYEGFKVPMAQWGRSVYLDEYSFYPSSATGDPFDFADGPGGHPTWVGANKKGERVGYWVQRGLENLMYITVGATYTPITPVTLGIDIFKLWAAETAPKDGFDPDSRIIYSKKQDSDLGWEIDLTAKWVLNKNFSVIAAFAPWIPGDFYKVPKGSRYVADPMTYDSTDPTTYTEITKSSDPDLGYVLRANCIFTF